MHLLQCHTIGLWNDRGGTSTINEPSVCEAAFSNKIWILWNCSKERRAQSHWPWNWFLPSSQPTRRDLHTWSSNYERFFFASHIWMLWFQMPTINERRALIIWNMNMLFSKWSIYLYRILKWWWCHGCHHWCGWLASHRGYRLHWRWWWSFYCW